MTNSQDTDRAGYDPTVNAPPAATPEKASLLEDFIDVFYAPSKVYARRQTASFWPYFWITSLVFAALLFASRSLTSAVFQLEFSRNMARAQADNPQLTAEMIEQSRGFAEMAATFGQYIAMPLFIVFGALFIWIAAKIVKAQVSWGAALLIAAIAQIPRLLSGLLTTIQALLMDVTRIAGAHQVGYSPARFMDPDASPQLLGLMARLDLFTLWVTLLLGIGVAVIGKVPRSKGYIAAAIAWLFGSIVAIISVLRA